MKRLAIAFALGLAAGVAVLWFVVWRRPSLDAPAAGDEARVAASAPTPPAEPAAAPSATPEAAASVVPPAAPSAAPQSEAPASAGAAASEPPLPPRVDSKRMPVVARRAVASALARHAERVPPAGPAAPDHIAARDLFPPEVLQALSLTADTEIIALGARSVADPYVYQEFLARPADVPLGYSVTVRLPDGQRRSVPFVLQP